ncbi:hypothetical protein EBQ74_03965 [bacterium]|nr:hypothetical protein [bacterium]
MKTQLALILIFILFSNSGFAVKEYYRLSRSVRSMGMGGAFYGLSNDEYALFANPAGLSLRRNGTEVMVDFKGDISSNASSGAKDFTNLSDLSIKQAIDRLDKYKDKPMYGNAGILPYFLTRNLAVGILLADTKLNFNISKSSEDITAGGLNNADEVADLTFISDSGLVVGYAQEVGVPDLHVGANLKGIYRFGGRKAFSLQEYVNSSQINFDAKDVGGSGIGVDLDLGATYEIKTLPFGAVSRASLVLSNLLGSQFGISKKYAGAPGLVRTLNLGWMTSFPGTDFIDNVHVLFDISDIPLGGEDDKDLGARTSGSFLKKTHLGVEVPMGRVSVRAGLNQGYLSAGLGFNLYALKLEFATYGEDTGDASRQQSRRYTATLALGWDAPPPAPITKAVVIEKEAPNPKPAPLKEESLEPIIEKKEKTDPKKKTN